jgi:hypothetical protein
VGEGEGDGWGPLGGVVGPGHDDGPGGEGGRVGGVGWAGDDDDGGVTRGDVGVGRVDCGSRGWGFVVDWRESGSAESGYVAAVKGEHGE